VGWRGWLLTTLFELSARPYAALHRDRQAWGLTAADLVAYPSGSLGEALGHHLHERGFELMPKLESHDVWHLLTGVGTDVVSEVALQYLLAGNGKRSPYLLAVVVLGGVVFPEAWAVFAAAFRRGRRLPAFHRWPVGRWLHEPIADLRERLAGPGRAPVVVTQTQVAR